MKCIILQGARETWHSRKALTGSLFPSPSLDTVRDLVLAQIHKSAYHTRMQRVQWRSQSTPPSSPTFPPQVPCSSSITILCRGHIEAQVHTLPPLALPPPLPHPAQAKYRQFLSIVTVKVKGHGLIPRA